MDSVVDDTRCELNVSRSSMETLDSENWSLMHTTYPHFLDALRVALTISKGKNAMIMWRILFAVLGNAGTLPNSCPSIM